jgi:hypothetical protein
MITSGEYDLWLSRRHYTIKNSQATSRVSWLKGQKKRLEVHLLETLVFFAFYPIDTAGSLRIFY